MYAFVDFPEEGLLVSQDFAWGRGAEGDKTSGTVEHMMKQLKALQRGKHTLDLACSIFADARVRTLGYMTLDIINL